MTVVGSHRMVQYDDTAADEAVRVFDRGMEFSTPKTFGEYQLTYRSGDIVVPRLEAAEPLSLELADFAHAIRTGAEPRSNAQLGLEIVLGDGGRRGVAAPQRRADRGHQPSRPRRRLASLERAAGPGLCARGRQPWSSASRGGSASSWLTRLAVARPVAVDRHVGRDLRGR